MKYFSISPRWGSKQVGYWSGIKVFYGPRLVGFWLNLAAGDTLEHCNTFLDQKGAVHLRFQEAFLATNFFIVARFGLGLKIS